MQSNSLTIFSVAYAFGYFRNNFFLIKLKFFVLIFLQHIFPDSFRVSVFILLPGICLCMAGINNLISICFSGRKQFVATPCILLSIFPKWLQCHFGNKLSSTSKSASGVTVLFRWFAYRFSTNHMLFSIQQRCRNYLQSDNPHCSSLSKLS